MLLQITYDGDFTYADKPKYYSHLSKIVIVNLRPEPLTGVSS